MTTSKKVLEKHLSDIFVETGTYHGNTAKLALNIGFKEVYTIELQRYIFDIAKKNLLNEIADKKINLFLGESSKILPIILQKIDKRATFYLDAHIDWGNYDKNLTPKIDWCPLIDELEIIGKHHIKNHIIIIDDLRLIGKEGWGLEISIDKLINKAMIINKNYNVIYEEDSLVFKV